MQALIFTSGGAPYPKSSSLKGCFIPIRRTQSQETSRSAPVSHRNRGFPQPLRLNFLSSSLYSHRVAAEKCGAADCRLQYGVACATLLKFRWSSGASRWPCGLPRRGKWEAGSLGRVRHVFVPLSPCRESLQRTSHCTTQEFNSCEPYRFGPFLAGCSLIVLRCAMLREGISSFPASPIRNLG